MQGVSGEIRLMLQDSIFYISLYVVALGTGGIKPNVSAFGADQFDEANPKVLLLRCCALCHHANCAAVVPNVAPRFAIMQNVLLWCHMSCEALCLSPSTRLFSICRTG